MNIEAEDPPQPQPGTRMTQYGYQTSPTHYHREEGELMPREKLYCELLAAYGDAHRAALEVGYSESYAREAYKWIRPKREKSRKPRLYDYYHQFIQEQGERCGITVQRVLKELYRWAFADIAECYDEQGNPIENPHEIPLHARQSLNGVKRKVYYTGRGEDRELVTEIELKHVDKLGAARTLAEYLGMIGRKLEIGGNSDSPPIQVDVESRQVTLELKEQSHLLKDLIRRAVGETDSDPN